jgi:lipopolysaccharide heptosyltransferase II
MTDQAAWTRARTVLCVRLDTIGDVVMTGPAIRALGQAVPGRRVILLTSPHAVEAAALLPDVSEIVPYDAPWMKATSPRDTSAPDHAIVARLRALRADAAVIFTVFSQSPLPAALLAYLADIPLRLAHCRENPYQLLSDWVRESEPQGGIRHEVRRQLDLVAAVGATTGDEGLGVTLPPARYDEARRLVASLGLDGRARWAVIHAGATAASRRYPWEYYAEVTRRLAEEGWTLVFTGTEPERELVDRIRHRAGAGGARRVQASTRSLAGSLDLAQLTALLSLAPLLISNNTGPVHLAAAVGTPVVDLYALTNPQHTPWGVPSRVLFHDVPCKYCYRSICPMGHHDCLRRLPPEDVVAAARALYRETRGAHTARPREYHGTTLSPLG